MKRAMEVMVWFYENFNDFFPKIQDEDGDGDAKDGNHDDENEDYKELTEEHPRYREEGAIFEEKLPSLADEQPVLSLQKESPFFTASRPAFKKGPSPLTEERCPPKEEQSLIEEEVFSAKGKRPAVGKERSTLVEELYENFMSARKEERSTLKRKRPILKKARSPRTVVRPTFKVEHSSLEKEGPTQFETFHRSEPSKTMLLEEPDLLLPEEIFSASQVEHLFSKNRFKNKEAFNHVVKLTCCSTLYKQQKSENYSVFLDLFNTSTSGITKIDRSHDWFLTRMSYRWRPQTETTNDDHLPYMSRLA